MKDWGRFFTFREFKSGSSEVIFSSLYMRENRSPKRKNDVSGAQSSFSSMFYTVNIYLREVSHVTVEPATEVYIFALKNHSRDFTPKRHC